MDDRLRLREMILATSVGINLLFTAILLHFLIKYPFDMDLIRYQYLEDAKFYYTRGCLDGTDYPEEYRQSVPGFNVNSSTNWCNQNATDKEQVFMSGMSELGKRRFR